ncbi:MAG: hypothetical protein E7545_04095 [Ruminococcaceae bacterium]|nr:hypothetical protein [Oscillospiraceae bacterium]
MKILNKWMIFCLGIVVAMGAMGLIYGIMVLSTNGIYQYVQQVITKQVIITDGNDPLSYFSNDSKLQNAAYSKFEFKRKNIWHNFREGQMTIVFSENIFDNNDSLIHQFENIEVIIYIKIQNGEWVVTNLKRVI